MVRCDIITQKILAKSKKLYVNQFVIYDSLAELELGFALEYIGFFEYFSIVLHPYNTFPLAGSLSVVGNLSYHPQGPSVRTRDKFFSNISNFLKSSLSHFSV